jgi:hypothetical protein
MMWSVVDYDKVHRMDLNGEEATNPLEHKGALPMKIR